MKILKYGQQCDIAAQVKQIGYGLKNNHVYVLSTPDPLEHIAAYLAWKEHGGNIFVKSPWLTPVQEAHIMSRLAETEVENAVLFNTSGTTNLPKLVVNHTQQLDQALKSSTAVQGWNKNTNFLNFLPAFVSGFWHMVLPALVQHDCTITLGSRDTAQTDLADTDTNLVNIVPGLMDQFRFHGVKVDFSHYEGIGCGASQVRPEHYQWVFNNGGRKFLHQYGATEVVSIPLARITTEPDMSDWFNFKLLVDGEAKLVNNELWISGPSVCSNYCDLTHEGTWYKTGDLFEQTGDLIRFTGRTNEVLKLNGYQCNLLDIETVAENNTSLGECQAIIRHSLGSDWIELFYTNPQATIDRNQLKSQFKDLLPKYSIPKKYTLIEKIPKNSLGKKLRHKNV